MLCGMCDVYMNLVIKTSGVFLAKNFSVAKATLESQMYVTLLVCKTPHTSKNQSFHFTINLITILTTISVILTIILNTIPTTILNTIPTIRLTTINHHTYQTSLCSCFPLAYEPSFLSGIMLIIHQNSKILKLLYKLF